MVHFICLTILTIICKQYVFHLEFYIDTIPLQGTYESGCISEYNGHYIYRSIIRCDKNNIVKEVIVYTVEHLDEECKNQYLETSSVYSAELSSEVSGMNNVSRL